MPPLKRLKSVTLEKKEPEANNEYKNLELSEHKLYIKCQNVSTMLVVRTALTAAEVVSFLSEAVVDLQAWDADSTDEGSTESDGSLDVSSDEGEVKDSHQESTVS